jgi:hypothetical protein
MDAFEKYIITHREEFDEHAPDPRIWSRIQKQLPRSGRDPVVMWKWIAVAAVGLVLILSGVIAGLYIGHSGYEDSAEYAEFKMSEKYYAAQFSERMATLAKYHPDPAVNRDIQELTELYNELSEELVAQSNPNKEQIIQAMIANYQTRIDLLERVLSRIEQSNDQFEINEDELPQM